MDEVLKKKIIQTVDDNRDEIIKLVQDMVRIPSHVVEIGAGETYDTEADYAEIVSFVSDKMNEYGMDVDLIGRAGKDYKFKMPSGTLKGTVGKPKLWFLGHIDTMPVGPRDTWDFEPLSGEIRDGKMLGRGTADNKGCFGPSLALPMIFRKAGVSLKGDLIVTGCLDEEISNAYGKTGIWQAIDAGEITSDFADWCIYVDGDVDRVSIGGTGILVLDITTYDPEGIWEHGERSPNAINKMAKIIIALEQLYHNVIRSRRTKIKDIARPWAILTSAIIHGGWKSNAPPQKCTLQIERRFIPEDDVDEAENEIRGIIEGLKNDDPDLKVDIKKYKVYPPHVTPNYRKLPTTKALLKYIKAVRGVEGQILGGGGGGPERHKVVLDAKIPLVSHGARLEASSFSQHRSNEFIEIDSIIDATKIEALTAAEILGVA